MRRVLVTGGAGYIGSHTCKALAQAGIEPIAYDSLENGHREAVKWGPLEEGNVRDRDRLDAVLRRYEPGAVLHFAAYIAAGESVIEPGKYYANNVTGSLTLLEAVRAAKVENFVFSSTAAVYGNPVEVPIDESHPLAPINPYGQSKLMVERMLADFGAAHGLRWTALRYFNAAGADPDGELGACHDPITHLIPLALRAGLGTGKTLTVFGDDYATPDGTAIRDYIHVSDLARAHVAALDYLMQGGESAAYNLGTGRGHSVRDVISMAGRVLEKTIPHRDGPRRPGDPPELVADARRATETFDWTPAYCALEDIVGSAAAWEKRKLPVG